MPGKREPQVVGAVMGGYVQCSECCTYFHCRKQFSRHLGKCTRDDFRYNYHFLNFVDDDDYPFFCYFGCEEKYRIASALEDHLIERHTEEDLRQWGISVKHILKGREKARSGKTGSPSLESAPSEVAERGSEQQIT